MIVVMLSPRHMRLLSILDRFGSELDLVTPDVTGPLTDADIDERVLASLGMLSHVAVERIEQDVRSVRMIVDLVTDVWDHGDARMRNGVLTCFLENFDNFEVDEVKAVHRLMAPHIQRLLEHELDRFGIDWMRDGDTNRSERSKRKERRKVGPLGRRVQGS